jgi:ubiquinone/menaquinone biosynthesis C-methylase UbiE
MISLAYLFDTEMKFWNEVYKKDQDHWIDKTVSNLTKYACKKYGPFKNVLEIGCASGVDTFYIADHTSQQVIGIDIIPKAIKIAQKNLAEQPEKIQKKVVLEIGDVEKLKYKDNQFDFIYSLSVFHSVDIIKAFKEIKRVLTFDGKAVIYAYLNEREHHHTYNDQDFRDEATKHFEIIKTQIKEIPSDAGGDNHTAFIMELRAN